MLEVSEMKTALESSRKEQEEKEETTNEESYNPSPWLFTDKKRESAILRKMDERMTFLLQEAETTMQSIRTDQQCGNCGS